MMTALMRARTLPCRGGGSCNGRKLPGPEMCRILGRKLPGPEMKALESGTRLGVEGSPGADRLVTDSAECSNLTGVSLALSSFAITIILLNSKYLKHVVIQYIGPEVFIL